VKTQASEPETLRIAEQYRRRPTGRVCVLECLGTRLTFHVWELETSGAAWRVEAHSGSGAEAIVVSRSAGTRVAALRDVGAAWAAGPGNPRFDWDKVQTLLASVRVV
jgi:hypothetical protein